MRALIRWSVAIIIIVLLSSAAVAQPQLPQPVGMVNDFAGKLTPQSKESLETLLTNFRDRSNGIEVVVVTLPYENLQDYPIEDYALRLGRQWGIGRGSEKAALLLLVAIKQPDGQGLYGGSTRLEVSRHLEGDIPDGLAGELIRRMRNDLRSGRFDQAVSTGVQTALATLAEKRNISMEGIERSNAYRPVAKQRPRGRSISPSLIIFLVFIFFVIISSLGGRGGGPGGRRRSRRGGLGSDWMLWPIIFGGGGSGGFGGSSGGYRGGSSWGGGGGGGGGFGGFGGGGDFGGGGASDSW